MENVTFEPTGFDLLEHILDKYNLAVEPNYDSEEDVTYCKIGGNGRNALSRALNELHEKDGILLVSTEENYWLTIEGEKLYLDCENVNNIINLDRSTLSLSQLVKDNGYQVETRYRNGKIKFLLSGGKGIDILSDLIWEAEQGRRDISFEQIPFYDVYIDVLKKLDVYTSENFTVEYLSDNTVGA